MPASEPTTFVLQASARILVRFLDEPRVGNGRIGPHRVEDIALALAVSAPTVRRAFNQLRDSGVEFTFERGPVAGGWYIDEDTRAAFVAYRDSIPARLVGDRGSEARVNFYAFLIEAIRLIPIHCVVCDDVPGGDDCPRCRLGGY